MGMILWMIGLATILGSAASHGGVLGASRFDLDLLPPIGLLLCLSGSVCVTVSRLGNGAFHALRGVVGQVALLFAALLLCYASMSQNVAGGGKGVFLLAAFGALLVAWPRGGRPRPRNGVPDRRETVEAT